MMREKPGKTARPRLSISTGISIFISSRLGFIEKRKKRNLLMVSTTQVITVHYGGVTPEASHNAPRSWPHSALLSSGQMSMTPARITKQPHFERDFRLR